MCYVCYLLDCLSHCCSSRTIKRDVFLHTEDVRLGIEHALSIDDISAAYPLLDVIDHDKSRAAVSIICVV